MHNTIAGLAREIKVTHWAVTDDTFIGAMMATHPDSVHAFVWPWSESVTGSPYPAGQIAVKLRNPDEWDAKTAGYYMDTQTVANIHTTSLETGEIAVNFGKAGFSRAVARWIKDYEAPFALEFKDYNNTWGLVQWCYGLDEAEEKLETLRRDYGVNAYRINRKRR